MQTITSRDNSLLRQARGVRDGKADELIFIEGLRLSEEAVRSGLTIASVIVSEELARKEKARELIQELEATTDRAAGTEGRGRGSQGRRWRKACNAGGRTQVRPQPP